MDRTHFIYPNYQLMGIWLVPTLGHYYNNAIMSIYVKVGCFWLDICSYFS